MKIICVEGATSVGKTTQAERLVSTLRKSGREAVYLPKEGTIRRVVRRTPVEFYDHKSMKRLSTAFLWWLNYIDRIENSTLIQPSTEYVVMDRYIYGCIAHGYELLEELFGSLENLVAFTHRLFAAGLPRPDLTVVFYVAEEEMRSRYGLRPEKYEAFDSFRHLQAQEMYGRLNRFYPEMHLLEVTGLSIEQVWERFRQLLIRQGLVEEAHLPNDV